MVCLLEAGRGLRRVGIIDAAVLKRVKLLVSAGQKSCTASLWLYLHNMCVLIKFCDLPKLIEIPLFAIVYRAEQGQMVRLAQTIVVVVVVDDVFLFAVGQKCRNANESLAVVCLLRH